MSTHRGVDPDQLTGTAAEQYARTVRMHEAFGASRERASRRAIDDLIEAGVIELSPFDTLVDSLRTVGMSEAGAKRAAIGREHRSEAEARQAMGEDPSGRRALSEVERQQVTESAQYRRYMELRESGVAPFEAADRATRESLRERYKLATNGSRTSLSESVPSVGEGVTCSCGVFHTAARCPRCGS